jgi:hypothetical protein
MTTISWRLIGVVVAVGLLVWGAMWTVGRIRVSYQAEQERDAAIENHKAYAAEAERKNAAATKQGTVDGAADTKTAQRIESLNSELADIRRLLAGMKPTVETQDAEGKTRVAISGDWWLCTSTFVTRDPADTATCEARAGARGVPNAVSH